MTNRPITIETTLGASPAWLRVRHLTKALFEAEVWELPFDTSMGAYL